MRLIIFCLLIAFPLAELFVLIKLFSSYGIWVLFYLVIIAMLGLQLIKEEKLLFSGKFMQQMTQGNSPLKAMFGSARNMIAGILLIIPGVITDVLAAILLLIPTQSGQQSKTGYTSDYRADDFEDSTPNQQKTTGKKQRPASEYEVIEGEYHRED